MTSKSFPVYPQLGLALAIAGLLTVGLCAHTTAATVDGDLKKTYAVSPGGKIVVDADRGSIDLNTTKGSEVQIEVFRKVMAASDNRAQEILDDHRVEFTQNGSTVAVRAKGKSLFNGWNSKGGRFDVRYVISVPEKFDADLKTAGGGIAVADLTGELKVHTSGGGLKLGNIQGPVNAHTSGGGITLAGCKGVVKAETSGGGIEIAEGEGSCVAKTSGGSIRIKTYKGDIVARTSGGGITTELVEGNVAASTSGGSISAILAGTPTGDSRLETSGGSITVKLPETAALDVDAEASGGTVRTELPIAILGAYKRNALKGKLNGGGKALVVHTSGGNINLKKL